MYRKCLFCSKTFKPVAPHHYFCSRNHARQYNKGNTWEGFIKRSLRNNRARKALSVNYMLKLLHKQGAKCALSGVELTKITGKGLVPTNASIDRIDPKKGYVPGNVRWLCAWVNSFRGNSDDKTLVWWCERIVNHG